MFIRMSIGIISTSLIGILLYAGNSISSDSNIERNEGIPCIYKISDDALSPTMAIDRNRLFCVYQHIENNRITISANVVQITSEHLADIQERISYDLPYEPIGNMSVSVTGDFIYIASFVKNKDAVAVIKDTVAEMGIKPSIVYIELHDIDKNNVNNNQNALLINHGHSPAKGDVLDVHSVIVGNKLYTIAYVSYLNHGYIFETNTITLESKRRNEFYTLRGYSWLSGPVQIDSNTIIFANTSLNEITFYGMYVNNDTCKISEIKKIIGQKEWIYSGGVLNCISERIVFACYDIFNGSLMVVEANKKEIMNKNCEWQVEDPATKEVIMLTPMHTVSSPVIAKRDSDSYSIVFNDMYREDGGSSIVVVKEFIPRRNHDIDVNERLIIEIDEVKKLNGISPYCSQSWGYYKGDLIGLVISDIDSCILIASHNSL